MAQLKLKFGSQTRVFFQPLIGAIGQYEKGFQKDGFSFKQFYDLNQTGDQNIKFIVLNLSTKPYILLKDPEMIQEFLQTQDNYNQMDVAPSVNILIPNSLITTKGGKWRRQRALIGNSFHYEALQGRVPLIKQITEQVIKNINTGQPQRVVHLSELITSEVMIKSFFSSDMKGKEINGRPVVDVLIETFQNGILIMGNPWFGIKMLLLGHQFALHRLQGKREKEFLKNAGFLRSIASEIINKRISSRLSDKNQSEIKDFLDLYVDAYIKEQNDTSKADKSDEGSITKDEIIDQFNGLFFAGTDTTGNLTGVCLYLLATYPEVQKKARAELQQHFKNPNEIEHSDLVKLEYLMAILHEALRIYGPANNLIPRVATQDLMIKDLEVQQGYYVGCFFFMNMMNPKYYENHLEFIPQRWIGQNSNQAQPFVYVPFSSGPRNCIGQYMAIIEAKIMLAYFLMNFEILPNPKVKFGMKFKFVYSPNNDELVYFQKL